MKKNQFLFAGILLATLLAPGIVKAAPLVLNEPMTSCGDQFTVTLTTYDYTAVPSTTTICAGRVGVAVRNPSTNSYNIICALAEKGLSGSKPTWAAGGGWAELSAGSYELLELGDQTRLYCYSLTAAEAIKGQEVKPDSKGTWR